MGDMLLLSEQVHNVTECGLGFMLGVQWNNMEYKDLHYNAVFLNTVFLVVTPVYGK